MDELFQWEMEGAQPFTMMVDVGCQAHPSLGEAHGSSGNALDRDCDGLDCLGGVMKLGLENAYISHIINNNKEELIDWSDWEATMAQLEKQIDLKVPRDVKNIVWRLALIARHRSRYFKNDFEKTFLT